MYDRRLIAECVKHPKHWPKVAKIMVAKILAEETILIRSDGVTLEGGTKNGQGLWCLVSGLDYEEELKAWLEVLKPGDVVLDIGANMGVYSIRAGQKVGPHGHVFAFEPLPETVARLKRNISYNKLDNITVLDIAVGDRDGVATLYEGKRQSSASVCHHSMSGPSHEVKVKTIDTVVKELKLARVDWIKMDIEGAEPAALAGMEETLARFKPSILFENGRDSGPASVEFLRKNGYVVGQYDVNKNWHLTDTGTNLFAKTS
jgi:FkbM family methyltransferase